ncbi:YolD-like family protein [Sinobaca sp. H24]|uniref:YolD-like family protein n=1 Tax=Sinobaca sp. H24 TaxID=2923376 RepID=UPI00207A4DC1|nr:YolD-like family protein [Sinobaca sp. H24]
MTENKLTPGSNMRWESSRMILPEHRDAWNERRASGRRLPKPLLDEQRLEELAWTLEQIIGTPQEYCFSYWEDGEYKLFSGRCQSVHPTRRLLHLTNEEEILYISFDVLVDIAEK